MIRNFLKFILVTTKIYTWFKYDNQEVIDIIYDFIWLLAIKYHLVLLPGILHGSQPRSLN